MTRDDLLRAHGPIELAASADAHFARLRQPHLEGGRWDKIRRKGKKILDGRFYTIGYFPEGVDPLTSEHDWEALDHAMRLTRELATLLREGGCRALSSEGDAPYFPFISTTCMEGKSLDYEAMGAGLPPELQAAYDNGDIDATYDAFVDRISLGRRACIFWSDERDGDHAEDLAPEAYQAYRRASDLLRESVEEPWKIAFYPDFVEFPVIYGGVDLYGSLVGVITSCVWT